MSALIPAPAADPWMISHNGHYYYCESRNQTTYSIRPQADWHLRNCRAENVQGLGTPVPGGSQQRERLGARTAFYRRQMVYLLRRRRWRQREPSHVGARSRD